LERTVDGLFIGRITPEKGVFDALDIWELVCAEQPGRQLELVGPCSSDMRSELQQRIDASPHLRSNVHIRGLVDEAKKTRLLQSSRVLLATSHVEGWGFVPLEALQCGTPTVAWDLPAYAESLPQGDATQRVPMHHRAEFVARVRDLLALDDTQRAELVRSTSDHEVTWDDVSKAELAVITKELVIT
jgi:glycosyltransferase involved in cell wall biosynthesis